MTEENKLEELNEEQLGQVSGGDSTVGRQVDGNCGIKTTRNGCTQYNDSNNQCKICPGKILEITNPVEGLVVRHGGM